MARAGIERERAGAGREPADERADAAAAAGRGSVLCRARCRPASDDPASVRGNVHALREPEACRTRFRLRRAHRDDDVMDDVARAARPDLDRLDPLVLGEVRGNLEVLVLDESVGGHLVVDRHRDDRVRLAERPAVDVLRRRRQILRISLGRAVVRPALDDGLLLRRSGRARWRTCRGPCRHATAA